MSLDELERRAYVLGDTAMACALADAANSQYAADEYERALCEAVAATDSIRKVLASVIQAAESFALDSDFDTKAIKELLSVLDDAKGSI